MNRTTTMVLLGLQLLCISLCFASGHPAEPATITVPLGGNGWVNKNAKARIRPEGITNWSSASDVISVYFKVSTPGNADLSIRVSVPEGRSKISLTAGETTLIREIGNLGAAIVPIGSFEIRKPGYVRVDFKGISRTGVVFGEISDLIVKGSTVANEPVYVKNNEGNFFYWGHRGPSVHLGFSIPEPENKTEWFYSEIVVPPGEDKQGSYYMANGFGEGYFGIQVNSATERRVLFSVWSPFHTDDPKVIPENQRIVLKRKGKATKTGEFGNEGSGGQSYLVYPWKAGRTYAFLTRAQPDFAHNTTTYTAYFREAGKPAEAGKHEWILIASFERPLLATYLKGLHSFLENFDPETGDQSRMANYQNQWAIDSQGHWHEVTKAVFTADQTARVNYRKDYAGGISDGGFYLKNCGFFDDFTPIRTTFIRKSSGKPVIDFSKLP